MGSCVEGCLQTTLGINGTVSYNENNIALEAGCMTDGKMQHRRYMWFYPRVATQTRRAGCSFDEGLCLVVRTASIS